jgi:hypothetical protein
VVHTMLSDRGLKSVDVQEVRPACRYASVLDTAEPCRPSRIAPVQQQQQQPTAPDSAACQSSSPVCDTR